MKHIRKSIAITALAALFALSCSPTYPELAEGLLPQASELDVTVTVDQSTNYATFVLNNTGMVPIWIFGTELIDGKAGKNYAYTGNETRLRFREAGTHTVEVKAYNANGVSVGSKMVEFTMNETYRDPFDPTPYINAFSNKSSQNWVWNYTEGGHFGCGPVGDPLAWWSCAANFKAGFLYDDVMTFDSEGNYTFHPGDGMAYANTGSEFMDEYNTTGEDFLFPAEEKTTRYTFENNWNDAGIEEIFLVLESGSILSYVPHKSAVEDPRFQLLETSAAGMKKNIQLMSTVYTPSNADGISWYYSFVPEGSQAVAADPLYGITQKIWVLDSDQQGYQGCGPDLGNPVGWWNAAPHDKDDYAYNDDELTFYKDGKYTYDPGADGMTYCNWESGWNPDGYYSGDGKTDYDAPAQFQESTYTLGSDADGDYIELPAGILFTYVPNKAVLEQPTRLYITENTQTKLVLVAKFDGIVWQFIFKPKDGQDFIGGGDEPTTDFDDTLWDPKSESNLWPGATIETELWYSPADWTGGITPEFTLTEGNGFTVVVPEGVGGSEWMGQTKLKSHIATVEGKAYDLAATIVADQDMTITVKLTNDPEEENDVHQFLYENNVQLEAGVPFTLRRANLTQKEPGESVMLIFDFGRSPVGSTITVSDVIFQEHTSANLWPSASIETELWYSPSDWSGGITPEFTLNEGNGFSVVVPEGVGGSEWMGQTKLKSSIASTPEDKYAFRCTILADQDMTITCKLTGNPEDENDVHQFFYDGGIQLEAGVPFTYTKTDLTQKEGTPSVMLIYDFGRSPIGSAITVSDVVFMKQP